jgi:hypothetical protein
MPLHRFRVGQMMELDPVHTPDRAPGRTYKILQLLPEAWGAVRYRIKSILELADRVVDEGDFGEVGDGQGVIWDRMAPAGKGEAGAIANGPTVPPGIAAPADPEAGTVRDTSRTAAAVRLDIHVGLDPEDTWSVSAGPDRPPLASFRVRLHAVAFARAVAFSRGVEMIVHDAAGASIRHPRASLTYPARLD